jgi:predicted amidophosphoribosyltransferase
MTTIPTHWTRRLKRFIHPADLVARELSKRKDIPLKKVLKRHKLTKYQWALERIERFKNVKGSFRVCSEVKGLKVLLIDDIYTSGATLNEASLMLKKAGATVVDCFIVAKSGA